MREGLGVERCSRTLCRGVLVDSDIAEVATESMFHFCASLWCQRLSATTPSAEQSTEGGITRFPKQARQPC
jgi:hypothetical protein